MAEPRKYKLVYNLSGGGQLIIPIPTKFFTSPMIELEELVWEDAQLSESTLEYTNAVIVPI